MYYYPYDFIYFSDNPRNYCLYNFQILKFIFSFRQYKS